MPKSNIPFEKYEHIRTWKSEGFRLELFDTHERGAGHDSNKCRLAYQFFDSNYRDDKKEQRIFVGDQFFCSPMHSIDGDNAVGGLLSFFGNDTDTDDEWTDEQKAWYVSRGEDIGLLAMELEEAANAHCVLCGEKGGAMARHLEDYSSPADTAHIFICYDCSHYGPQNLSDEWNAVPGYETEGD